MAGLLSGLDSLGLGGLESLDIFEKPKAPEKDPSSKAVTKTPEKDYLYDRTFECPVCGNKFTSKTIRTGKAKLLQTDQDLRPQYEGLDLVKYDVPLCPLCGYAALTRYHSQITDTQAKLIKENISTKVTLKKQTGEIYTYDDAIERYKLALVCAVVKRSKDSEKAYICLKSAWLLRGYQEALKEAQTDPSVLEDNAIDPSTDLTALGTKLEAEENNYLKNAYEGFIEARKKEPFPMAGMDETTIDYLLCVLAYRFRQYDVASRLISGILTSSTANNRIKDKTRELKEMIMQDIKKSRQTS
ncbi:MAG: DUF2225 domain-containing protein [Clostridium sp.]|jgi:uncharacterized protein (DUF2225 family)|nr:DUF2225 domain-containing protein [Clostridium sp.]